jgi:beta-xylosidase
MIEAFKIWNEPNNLSHWDFQMDPEWKEFAALARIGSEAVKQKRPGVPVVLGGLAPIDPAFLRRMMGYGLLEHFDAVAVHGFPLDWNHWSIHEWPEKLRSIQALTDKPVWVTEVGVSTFGAEEVQVFGLRKTRELLRGRTSHIFWYSLMDLPHAWGATTRHKESEGSSYYRHFYMGLLRPDGSPKPAIEHFDPELGICQWFHFEDPRLDEAVAWLKRLKVKKLRTGISWGDWHRPGAVKWFDRQMEALRDFDVTVTLCFTPPSRGKRPDHTSPPQVPEEFGHFAGEVADRYCE